MPEIITLEWIKNHPWRNKVIRDFYHLCSIAGFGFEDCPSYSPSPEQRELDNKVYVETVKKLRGMTYIQACEEMWPGRADKQLHYSWMNISPMNMYLMKK